MQSGYSIACCTASNLADDQLLGAILFCINVPLVRGSVLYNAVYTIYFKRLQ